MSDFPAAVRRERSDASSAPAPAAWVRARVCTHRAWLMIADCATSRAAPQPRPPDLQRVFGLEIGNVPAAAANARCSRSSCAAAELDRNCAVRRLRSQTASTQHERGGGVAVSSIEGAPASTSQADLRPPRRPTEAPAIARAGVDHGNGRSLTRVRERRPHDRRERPRCRRDSREACPR